jgi:TRAP-type mannitol/chloroaromatic compound transport system permease small subunit
MSPLRTFVRAVDGVSRLAGYLAALLVLLLIALMVYEVVVRYVFSAPTIWNYEVSTWVMGASFVLAIGYALSTGSHVRIDLLQPLLPAKAQAAIDLAGYALILLPLLSWLTWEMWSYFQTPYLTGERSGQSAWNPVIWPFRLVLFAGVVVWTLQTAAEIAKCGCALADRPLEAASAPPVPQE